MAACAHGPTADADIVAPAYRRALPGLSEGPDGEDQPKAGGPPIGPGRPQADSAPRTRPITVPGPSRPAYRRPPAPASPGPHPSPDVDPAQRWGACPWRRTPASASSVWSPSPAPRGRPLPDGVGRGRPTSCLLYDAWRGLAVGAKGGRSREPGDTVSDVDVRPPVCSMVRDRGWPLGQRVADRVSPAMWCRTWTSNLLSVLWCAIGAGSLGGGWPTAPAPAEWCRTWTSDLLSALWCVAGAGRWGKGWPTAWARRCGVGRGRPTYSLCYGPPPSADGRPLVRGLSGLSTGCAPGVRPFVAATHPARCGRSRPCLPASGRSDGGAGGVSGRADRCGPRSGAAACRPRGAVASRAVARWEPRGTGPSCGVWGSAPRSSLLAGCGAAPHGVRRPSGSARSAAVPRRTCRRRWYDPAPARVGAHPCEPHSQRHSSRSP